MEEPMGDEFMGDEFIHSLNELIQREQIRKQLLNILFPKQRKIAKSKARFKALICGRRSGKTYLCAVMILLALLDGGHNEWVFFGQKTMIAAKQAIWLDLLKIISDVGLTERWKIHNGNHTIETPHGTTFQLIGFNDSGQVELLRGKKFRLFIADEASTYEDLLQQIIDTVDPTLGEALDEKGNKVGSFVISGTPGYAKAGKWFRISTGAENRGVPEDWELQSWTLLENPHYPDAKGELATIRRKNGWTEEDAAYRREWLGEWVEDAGMLVHPYNSVHPLPVDWDWNDGVTSTLGIDYGFNDSTGWVVISQRRDDPRGYVTYAFKEAKLLPHQLAEITKRIVDRFKVVKAVADPAAGGKTFYTDFNRLYGSQTGVYIESAEKPDWRGRVELLNADLKTGRLLITAEARTVATEMSELPFKDEHRDADHPAYDNHCTDALRYAHRALRGALDLPKEEKPRRTKVQEDQHKWMLEQLEQNRELMQMESEWKNELF